jgi:hypothetical protein
VRAAVAYAVVFLMISVGILCGLYGMASMIPGGDDGYFDEAE